MGRSYFPTRLYPLVDLPKRLLPPTSSTSPCSSARPNSNARLPLPRSTAQSYPSKLNACNCRWNEQSTRKNLICQNTYQGLGRACWDAWRCQRSHFEYTTGKEEVFRCLECGKVSATYNRPDIIIKIGKILEGVMCPLVAFYYNCHTVVCEHQYPTEKPRFAKDWDIWGWDRGSPKGLLWRRENSTLVQVRESGVSHGV